MNRSVLLDDDLKDKIDDLESRVDDLENRIEDLNDSDDYGYLRLIYIPGMILAMIISWDINHSALWAIIHGFLSWAYVIYHLLFVGI